MDPAFDLWEASEYRDMFSTVRVRRPTGVTVAGDGATATAATEEIYAGWASVLAKERERTLQAGQQATDIADYRLMVPRDVAVAAGDLIDIVTCPDAQAEGRTLRVARVLMGERTTSRVVDCEDVT